MAKIFFLVYFFRLVTSISKADSNLFLPQIQSNSFNITNATISKNIERFYEKDVIKFGKTKPKNEKSTVGDIYFKREPTKKIWSKCEEDLNNVKEIIEKNVVDENKIKNLKLYIDDLKFEIIHDSFETGKGIYCGLMYKVQLTSVSTNIKRFFVETVSSDDGTSRGNFVGQSLRTHLPTSWFQLNIMKTLYDPPEYQGDDLVCTGNKWMESLENKTKAFSYWMVNEFCDTLHTIDFRIYFLLASFNNTKNIETFYKKNFLIQLRQDCKFWLKNSAGILDYTILPTNSTDCTIFFPSYQQILFGQLPGFSIKLTRLNIPCNSESFIQFTGRRKLCGKLEELNENELYFHFNVNENASIRIYKNTMFSFKYRLVDYCYKKVITGKNSTFLIKPIRDSLECYFKIHLPYGNKINITIITNYNGNESIDLNTEHIFQTNLSYNEKDDKILNKNYHKNNLCNGIMLNVIEDDVIQLDECVLENSESKKMSYLSISNILGISVQKYSIPESYGDIIMNTNIFPSILLSYVYEPIQDIVSECDFGWILISPFCVKSIERQFSWIDGEKYCADMDGHLASIRSENDQKLIDKMVFSSPGYQNHFAYWVGGSDITIEGDFTWVDGFVFEYSNWFPGWSQYNNYNKQPNDDGLSSQDCIELRKDFRSPAGIELSSNLLPSSLMWNDRDCSSKNYIICEKYLSDELIQTRSWINECNNTISLTKELPKATIWSPLFPREYPENANCYTTVIAPNGYRIVLEFEELVIENELGCSYDFLELTEPSMMHENYKNTFKNISTYSRHSSRHNSYGKRNSYESIKQNENYQTAQENIKTSLNLYYDLYKIRKNYLIKTPNYPKGNVLFQSNVPEENLPKRICGDWSSKLKLLKYTSSDSNLGIHFVSDYSHNFSGFRAKVYMENSASVCSDDRLKAFGDSCYLFVSYPEVDWWTAQQICKGIGAQLSSVSSSFEHKFITTNIRNQADYTPQVIYWLGAELAYSGQFEWTDDTKMDFEGFFPGQYHFQKFTNSICLALQWKMSSLSSFQSGLYWEAEQCQKIGGYVCKKKMIQFKDFELSNETVIGVEGRLTSPGYPGIYPTKTDYWVHVIAPEGSRVIVQFQRIDMESQDECLYDFISIQNYDPLSHIVLEPGINAMPMAMLKSDGNMEKKSFESNNNLRRIKRSSNNLKQNKFLLPNQKNSYAKYNFLISKKKTKRSFHSNGNIFLKHVVKQKTNQNSPSFLPYVRWCGQHNSNMTKFDFVSMSNQITINFHSDYSISGLGFSAIWKAIDMSGCPKKSLTSREGIVNSPNYPHFLINSIDCTFVIQAPIGKKILLEFTDFDILEGGILYVDIGNNNFRPYRKKKHLNEGIFISMNEKIQIQIITSQKPLGRGFQASFKTISGNPLVEERIIQLSNNSFGELYHLNYPEQTPYNVDFTQHLIAPLGEMILLEIYDVEFTSQGCPNNNKIEIFDYYADNSGTRWILCEKNKSLNIDQPSAPVHITSYLNTIHIQQITSSISNMDFNASIRIQPDSNLKLKLAAGDDLVETCNPNPCFNSGKCIVMGNKKKCQCHGHFTGRFCALNLCELEPCIFGKCELTMNSFNCHCQPNYVGQTCEQKQKPCADNPCEGRGECFEKNGVFACRCHAWWEGQKCERRMLHIPYKPLSERMLQEPFWLGLITVFVVLAFIGLVWCAKRHFPEKIEKLLAEEADRNRPAGLVLGHHHTSLREQLQFTSSIPHNTIVNPQAPRSIFNRLGIRKPSLLSSSNVPEGATARTFSLDDLNQPLPRRLPSPRKKRNNSTPVKKNVVEKNEILQQLVSPSASLTKPKLSLDELIQMSENRLKAKNVHDSDKENKETIFSEELSSSPQQINDMKLEKKVTFALLLNKVSAEMNTCSTSSKNNEKTSSTPNFLPDIMFQSHSAEPSPNTNFISITDYSPQNEESELFSSCELISVDVENKINTNNNKKIKIKASSADSILAMFRNFVPSTGINNCTPVSSNIISPSTTPTVSQNDPSGEDDFSLSSTHNSLSFSSGAPDSPIFYSQATIEVPITDTANRQIAIPFSNLLNPSNMLLQIPTNGTNMCLSPIKELPTPMPSPAITPIMPRPHRKLCPITLKQKSISPSYSDDDDENDKLNPNSKVELNPSDFLLEVIPHDSEQEITRSETFTKRLIENTSFFIGDEKIARPQNLIIPTLLVEHPSPNKERLPNIIFSGSPPPQRESFGETSYIFSNKLQKRILKHLDKPASLDLCCTPPKITITSNKNELESELDSLSPNLKINGSSRLVSENSGGMCYLSPFSICTRADRTISESNLSSSGYSSMASPGPSRCGSNNPLCSNEMDEVCNSSLNFSLQANLISRRPNTILFNSKENFNFADKRENQRTKSDLETLSDDYLFESNDEGIGTDHIEEKINKTKKSLALELHKNDHTLGAKKILITEEVKTMAHLQLPSILVQIEINEKGISPVSSRSESPLSDRAGVKCFSSHFYGEKNLQLPFTDSDGLYDFPSSDGKRTPNNHQKRSNGKKRERKLIKNSSPPKSQIELPLESISNCNCSKHFYLHHHACHNNYVTSRKNPKKRPAQSPSCRSSSSSTESLTCNSKLYSRISESAHSQNRGISTTKIKVSTEHESDAYDYNSILQKKTSEETLRYTNKTNRLKAIGNQIRFLRRLEKSIKRHQNNQSSYSSFEDENSSGTQKPSFSLLNATKSKISASNNRPKCLRNVFPNNLYSTNE